MIVLGVTSAFGSAGCDKDSTDPHRSTAPKGNELPPLELKDDTPNLLLTWLDEKGEFHVVQKIADVPENARGHVRVVQTTSSDGAGDLLYVADLTKKDPAGSYHVETMSRSQWDELGASRRRKRLEALAPSARPEFPPLPSAAPSAPEGALSAIIYGAEWCKPCHQAEAYLKSRGVKVVHKDIERDPGAAREMQQKLAKAGLGAGSIPVIDLGGRLFKGFSPSALDRAIGNLRKSETL
ncbi:MAG: glutaredoxin domain-containing protein [Polyangiaceae bacterium]